MEQSEKIKEEKRWLDAITLKMGELGYRRRKYRGLDIYRFTNLANPFLVVDCKLIPPENNSFPRGFEFNFNCGHSARQKREVTEAIASMSAVYK